MAGDRMRRRLLSFVALAVLAASLAAPALTAVGHSVTLPLGSTFTVTGRTGSVKGKHDRAVGKVVVSGRWGNGSWYLLTTTRTDQAGNYAFKLRPHRRGDLTILIEPPDQHARHYLLHVY